MKFNGCKQMPKTICFRVETSTSGTNSTLYGFKRCNAAETCIRLGKPGSKPDMHDSILLKRYGHERIGIRSVRSLHVAQEARKRPDVRSNRAFWPMVFQIGKPASEPHACMLTLCDCAMLRDPPGGSGSRSAEQFCSFSRALLNKGSSSGMSSADMLTSATCI